MVTSFKNSSPSEEMQRRSAGILFTMNDLQKKGPNFKNFKRLVNVIKM